MKIENTGNETPGTLRPTPAETYHFSDEELAALVTIGSAPEPDPAEAAAAERLAALAQRKQELEQALSDIPEALRDDVDYRWESELEAVNAEIASFSDHGSAEDTPADDEPAADEEIDDEFDLIRPRPPFQPESQTEEEIAAAAAEAARVAAEEAQLAEERLKIHVRSRSPEDLQAIGVEVDAYVHLSGGAQHAAWAALDDGTRAVYEKVYEIKPPEMLPSNVLEGLKEITKER